MTEEAQRRALAELEGYVFIEEGRYIRTPDGIVIQVMHGWCLDKHGDEIVPCYPHDRDAICNLVEDKFRYPKGTWSWSLYQHNLEVIVSRDVPINPESVSFQFEVANAHAGMRCEAALRAVHKWTGGELVKPGFEVKLEDLFKKPQSMPNHPPRP